VHAFFGTLSEYLQNPAGLNLMEGSVQSEMRVRIELAAAYRIAALEKLDDGVFNHFSCAVPGEAGHFLLKPFGPLFEEAHASGLIKVDLDGHVVAGSGHWEPTAFFIHSRIHRAVPRAMCIMHSHMPYATALSSLQEMRILPVNQSSMRYIHRTASLENYAGLVLDNAEADQIVAAFAEKDVLLMANHGVMVIGPSVAECLYDLHYFEIAARDQWLARSAGVPLRMVDSAVVDRAAGQMVEERRMASQTHLAAMMRRLDRINPGYAN
jgi:ribulose-5-phosphate 4-epimerase/fuculose-1-phosphate aldolase